MVTLGDLKGFYLKRPHKNAKILRLLTGGHFFLSSSTPLTRALTREPVSAVHVFP